MALMVTSCSSRRFSRSSILVSFYFFSSSFFKLSASRAVTRFFRTSTEFQSTGLFLSLSFGLSILLTREFFFILSFSSSCFSCTVMLRAFSLDLLLLFLLKGGELSFSLTYSIRSSIVPSFVL